MRRLSRTLITTTFLTLAVTACSDSSTNDLDAGDTGSGQGGSSTFTLSSRAVVDGELLAEFQCEQKIDGVEDSIPLQWSGVPDGTESLAVTMHHYPNANDETSVNGYLQLWNIDPETTEIEHGAADDGPWFLGANKDGATISYSSPCSPSAGSHSYTITLYALTSDPVLGGLLPAESSIDVDYAVMLSAVEASGIVAETTLTFDSTSGVDTASGDSSVCEGYDGAFAPVSDLVSHECNETYLSITSETGLPPTQNVSDDETILVGITSWIQRVPIPYTYEWNVPLNPAYSEATTEASPKGPIAVAVDGVPIFHYERRPDVSTALAAYTAENDTVLAGELDQCGGHAGQDDDYHYHYHYTPVCLLDEHDLSQPLAFGLDGTPVYFGEGGTDYYGRGLYNEWNNFPEGMTVASLDECNAVLQADGSYRHYTTKTPPYLIGCHHAPFDTALQIEPAPMEGREQGTAVPSGGQFGEPVTTLITDFVHGEDGEYTLKYQAIDGRSVSSELVYRQVSDADDEVCWEFEFRTTEGQAGQVQTACRTNNLASPATAASSFEHGHVH